MEDDLPRPRCWYFQSHPKGCSREDCFFCHDYNIVARPPVCTYWDRGTCRFSDDCVFFHDKGNDVDVRGDWSTIPLPKNVHKTDTPNDKEKKCGPKSTEDGWDTVPSGRGIRRHRHKDKCPPIEEEKNSFEALIIE
jgi:hypothetical protein